MIQKCITVFGKILVGRRIWKYRINKTGSGYHKGVVFKQEGGMGLLLADERLINLTQHYLEMVHKREGKGEGKKRGNNKRFCQRR